MQRFSGKLTLGSIAARRYWSTNVRRAAIPAFVHTPNVRSYSGASAPSKKEIEHRVLVLLKEFDKIDHSKLNMDSHFIKDLGLDSLDQVEITMALEEEFHIEIPDKDADEILTPLQAVEKIYSNKDAI